MPTHTAHVLLCRVEQSLCLAQDRDVRACDIVPLLKGRTVAAVKQMAEAPLIAVDGAR